MCIYGYKPVQKEAFKYCYLAKQQYAISIRAYFSPAWVFNQVSSTRHVSTLQSWYSTYQRCFGYFHNSSSIITQRVHFTCQVSLFDNGFHSWLRQLMHFPDSRILHTAPSGTMKASQEGQSFQFHSSLIFLYCLSKYRMHSSIMSFLNISNFLSQNVCVCCVLCACELEVRGIRSPGAGVTGRCELPYINSRK